MVALLVGLGVMSVMLSMALPVWRTMIRREQEAELVFRGQQYARAISLYQRKFPAAYPPSIDFLVKQRFLRREYKDPVNKEGAFQLLYQSTSNPVRPGGLGGAAGGQGRPGSSEQGAGSTGPGSGGLGRPAQETQPGGAGRTTLGAQGGIVGVASKSKGTSLRVYNGRSKYNEWEFVWTPAALTPGGGQPGPRGPGQPGTGPNPRGSQGSPSSPRQPGGLGRPGGSTPPGIRPGGSGR
jgi:type II secretory pathway pseudopilin PulG